MSLSSCQHPAVFLCTVPLVSVEFDLAHNQCTSPPCFPLQLEGDCRPQVQPPLQLPPSAEMQQQPDWEPIRPHQCGQQLLGVPRLKGTAAQCSVPKAKGPTQPPGPAVLDLLPGFTHQSPSLPLAPAGCPPHRVLTPCHGKPGLPPPGSVSFLGVHHPVTCSHATGYSDISFMYIYRFNVLCNRSILFGFSSWVPKKILPRW